MSSEIYSLPDKPLSQQTLPVFFSSTMKRKKGPNGKQKKTSKIKKSKKDSALIDVDMEDSEAAQTISLSQAEVLNHVECESPYTDVDENRSGASDDVQNMSLSGIQGPARVRVKLKTSSEMASSTQISLEGVRNNPKEPLHDNNGPSENFEKKPSHVSGTGSVYSSRKFGSIKIKSSKGLGISNSVVSTANATKSLSASGSQGSLPKADQPLLSESSDDVTQELYYTNHPFDPVRDQKELTTALGVIKKVMKMDAAEPFNAPVNAVALGIPDYYDIIETPMDFGTICKELEHGTKYRNSKDVYVDVQYIWSNCSKYNNKGDYILDLMKRVKKNFMKLWLPAGLYYDSTIKDPGSQFNGVDDAQMIDTALAAPKSAASKYKSRKRHRIYKHKADCLCAVCVARRRRREREGNAIMVESEVERNSGKPLLESMSEEKYDIENHLSDDESSSDEESLGNAACVDMSEEIKYKMSGDGPLSQSLELPKKRDLLEMGPKTASEEIAGGSFAEHPTTNSKGKNLDEPEVQNLEQPYSLHEENEGRVMTASLQHDSMKLNSVKHHQEGFCPVQGLKLVADDALPLPSLRVFNLCKTLFPCKSGSVWSGHHSLKRVNTVSRANRISLALSTFME